MFWVGIGFLALTGAGIAAAGYYWVRLRYLATRAGAFECARWQEGHWRAGIARYERDRLLWFLLVSFSWRPHVVWARSLLQVGSPKLREGSTHIGESVCEFEGGSFVLGAEQAALEGLVSWSEASPPGVSSHTVV